MSESYFTNLQRSYDALTGNYWKCFDDETARNLLVGSDSSYIFEDHCHYALGEAMIGLDSALTRYPQEENLRLIERTLLDAVPRIGYLETQLISLVHGKAVATLQRRMADEYSEELRSAMVNQLDQRLLQQDDAVVADFLENHRKYRDHLRSLAEVYKERTYGFNGRRPLSARRETLQAMVLELDDRVDDLWSYGVLHGHSWV